MVEQEPSERQIEYLRQQIAEENVVAVVGAGVSIGATEENTLASWVGLLKSGVQRCEQVVRDLPDGWGERVRQEIDSGDMDDLLSAAEKIREANSVGEANTGAG